MRLATTRHGFAYAAIRQLQMVSIPVTGRALRSSRLRDGTACMSARDAEGLSIRPVAM